MFQWSTLPRVARLVPLVLLTACIGAHLTAPPAVAPTRTLALGVDDARPGAPKPFAVVFGGPQGATVDPTEVTVVFNRPMRPLDLAGEESAPPAVLHPAGATHAPPGRWLWLGTSSLVFAPEGRLPRATAYEVTVPAGTKALDGSTLASPYAFTFTTPRPRLVGATPEGRNEGDRIVPTQTFELRFDQAVDAAEVERAARLVVGGNDGAALARVAVRARRAKDGGARRVELVPAAPLPLGADVVLTLDPSLHGVEGPLPMGPSEPVRWRTYGALQVVSVTCDHDEHETACEAGAGITVTLSNAVRYTDALRYIAVDHLGAATWGARNDDTLDDERPDGDDVDLADDTVLTELRLPGHLPPDHRTVVTVRAGLTDEYGQKLAHDATFTFVSKPEPEMAAIGLTGQTLEAVTDAPGRLAPRQVPIQSVNVPAFDVLTAAVPEASVVGLLATRDLSDAKNAFDAFLARIFALKGASVSAVRPVARPNVEARFDVPLADPPGTRPVTGARALGLRVGGKPSGALLSVTDLAVTAKTSLFGDVFWITHLSSGAPVPGATVTLRDDTARDLATATTDADGIAKLPTDPGAPQDIGWRNDRRVVFVRAGDDWTFHAMWQDPQSATPGQRWRVRADGELRGDGDVFLDRGVYAAGETAHVKGFFRKRLARGTSTPAAAPVTVKAVSGTTEILDRVVALDAYGGFAVDVPIPRSAERSRITVEAQLGRDVADTSAMVADFQPAEFSADVSADTERAYARGDAAAFTVHGDYLFGAPMSGAKVRWTATRSPAAFWPPGSDGLVCNDEAYALPAAQDDDRVGVGTGVLDVHGVYAGAVPLTMPRVAGSQYVTIAAEVEDASRRTVAGRTGVFVHPADFTLGIQPPDDVFVPIGTHLRARVAAIEPSGKRRAGVPVHVEVLRSTWDGTGHAPRYHALGGCNATTTDAASLPGCDVVLPRYGDYVVRATARDGRGNDVASSFDAFALGGPSSSDKVQVTTDKKEYAVGDVAQVAIVSPWPEADALVTVERAGVYRTQRVPLHASSGVVRIPVTDDLWPNAHVVAHVVRGRTADAPPHGGYDPGRPDFRVAFAPLSIRRDAHTLAVTVTPDRRDHRPGDEVDLDVAVKTREGAPAPASVTLWAVDEGALALTGYVTPNPAPAFARDRPLAVFGLDSRTDLARIHDHLHLGSFGHLGGRGFGAGGSSGTRGPTRADFRPTAFFEPSLATGPDGRLHRRFKLPDGLTKYRIMAVAATAADRFGSGEGSVVTSQPLMARPSLPRFLRAGDTLQAGVLLTSKGLPATAAEVTIEATGVTVVGDASRSAVPLPAGGTVEVTWPVRATTGGTATFAFSARAGGASDRVKVTREVTMPVAMEAVALSGATTSAAAEQLGDLRDTRPDVGGLDVRVASTALVGLGDGIDQLLKYPYGCTEQLSSRLVALVPLRGLAKAFDLPMPAQADRAIDDAIAKIEHNQQPDGSFGYWPDSVKGDMWVTAYALWALGTARAAGHVVAYATTEHATRALGKYVADEAQSRGVDLATKAFIVDVLTSQGDRDLREMRALFAAREHLPLFARALLAHAFLTTGLDPAAPRELLRDLEGHLRVSATGATVAETLGDAFAPVLDSEARTTAIVLRALLAQDKASPLAARLAHGLLDVRRGGTWRTTQETAWALLALDDYRAAQEAAAPDFDADVFHGPVLLARAPFHGRTTREVTLSLPLAGLAGGPSEPLTFAVEGSGSLFYEARLRYAKKTLPEAPLDRGFGVRKVVRAASAEGLPDAVRSIALASTTSAHAGQLVLVDLFVTTTDPRERVVVDDPLPAGLQPVETRFATTAEWLDVDAAGDRADADARDDDGVGTVSSSWYRREVRDDRVLTFIDHMPAGLYHYRYVARAVTAGTFVVPPTRAECMYEPETFGRTAAGAFEVKP
jgi:uncharacterized protein YfaS (alpha-2-macroglobulin family)